MTIGFSLKLDVPGKEFAVGLRKKTNSNCDNAGCIPNVKWIDESALIYIT